MASKRHRSKKWLYWLLVLVLLIAAAVASYLVWDNYFKGEKSEEAESSEQVEEEAEKQEETEKEDDVNENPEVEVDDKTPTQYEGEDPNEQEELSGSITYAGLMNGNVAIRVNIDQFLSEGNCELSIVKGKEVVYNENTRIVSSASTSTCEGFDFKSPAVTSGKYSVIIRITSGEKSGLIGGVLEI